MLLSAARRTGALAVVTAFALVCAACSPSSPETVPDASTSTGSSGCTLPFLGDEAADPVVELVALGADETSFDLADGAEIPLILPPQGGRVIFAGVRATNIDACGVKLAGAVRDLQNAQVRIDTRTINLEPTGDGWGRSVDANISTFANVPMCPNQWAASDVFDHPFELEVTLTDRDHVRKATRTVEITPKCAQPENAAECLCICKKGYVLGEPCGAGDGGAGGSGGAGGGSP